MLFDPKWGVPKEPSLDGMIRWMETLPPEKAYPYSDCRKCLCAQYYNSMGRGFWDEVCGNPGPDRDLAIFLNREVAEGAKDQELGRWTVGRALARARKIQTTEVPVA